MIQAWAKLARLTATASGWTRNRTMPAATNGTTCAAVVSVHSRPRLRRRAASIGGRQWTAAVSGSGATCAADRLHHPPLIGSRRITRSASIGSSLTCSAWPSPVETIAK